MRASAHTKVVRRRVRRVLRAAVVTVLAVLGVLTPADPASAAGAIVIDNVDINAVGDVEVNTLADAAGPGDDVTVTGTASITSSGEVRILAADTITLQSGSAISSGDGIVLDSAENDTDGLGDIFIAGQLTSDGPITATAGSGDNTVTVDFQGGATIAGPLAVDGGAGTDTLDVDVAGTGSPFLTVVTNSGGDLLGQYSFSDRPEINFAGIEVLSSVPDLAISKTDGETIVSPGSTVIYFIIVSNLGPVGVHGATVSDAMPASLTGATWTCTALTSGSACGATNGVGNISESVSIEAGGGVLYEVEATLSPTATGPLVNTATVSAGGVDPTAANNTATDSDAVTVPLTVTAPSPSIAYGQALPALEPSYSGSDPSTPAACSTTATATSGAGTYPVTCSGAADPSRGPIAYVDGTLTVTPAALHVVAPSLTVTEGDPFPPLPPTYVGLQHGATAPSTPASCTAPVTDTAAPGTFAVMCGAASDSNYAPITYSSGTLTVNALPPVPTSLTVASVLVRVSPFRITVGPLSATLSSSRPVGGQLITFRAGSVVVCSAVTTASGFATCTPTLGNTVLVVLSGGVTATFAGTNRLLPSSGSAGLIG